MKTFEQFKNKYHIGDYLIMSVYYNGESALSIVQVIDPPYVSRYALQSIYKLTNNSLEWVMNKNFTFTVTKPNIEVLYYTKFLNDAKYHLELLVNSNKYNL